MRSLRSAEIAMAVDALARAPKRDKPAEPTEAQPVPTTASGTATRHRRSITTLAAMTGALALGGGVPSGLHLSMKRDRGVSGTKHDIAARDRAASKRARKARRRSSLAGCQMSNEPQEDATNG